MKILDVSSFEKLKINPMSINDFDKIGFHEENKYKITKDNLTGGIKDFPLGVVVRMLEEMEKQGYEPNIKKIIINPTSVFIWNCTEDGRDFWSHVISGDFDKFFEKYPEYKRYN